MPVNKHGLTPDVIINPHAMPSRMTIGQLLETLLGTVCCMKGFLGDGTPFSGASVEDMCRLLGTPVEQGGCGMPEVIDADGTARGFGNQVLYNGQTGEMLACKVFMGPCYYMRSKHMVCDKYHSRATGPHQLLTRQPPEGRARAGAGRVGEMERDVLCSHSCASFLKERFLDLSDKFRINVDRNTGLLTIGDPDNLTLREDHEDVKACMVPWPFRLLCAELMSMGIVPRLTLA